MYHVGSPEVNRIERTKQVREIEKCLAAERRKNYKSSCSRLLTKAKEVARRNHSLKARKNYQRAQSEIASSLLLHVGASHRQAEISATDALNQHELKTWIKRQDGIAAKHRGFLAACRLRELRAESPYRLEQIQRRRREEVRSVFSHDKSKATNAERDSLGDTLTGVNVHCFKDCAHDTVQVDVEGNAKLKAGLFRSDSQNIQGGSSINQNMDNSCRHALITAHIPKGQQESSACDYNDCFPSTCGNATTMLLPLEASGKGAQFSTATQSSAAFRAKSAAVQTNDMDFETTIQGSRTVLTDKGQPPHASLQALCDCYKAKRASSSGLIESFSVSKYCEKHGAHRIDNCCTSSLHNDEDGYSYGKTPHDAMQNGLDTKSFLGATWSMSQSCCSPETPLLSIPSIKEVENLSPHIETVSRPTPDKQKQKNDERMNCRSSIVDKSGIICGTEYDEYDTISMHSLSSSMTSCTL